MVSNMEIFDELKNHIGEIVKISFFASNSTSIVTQELKDVDDFTSVTVGNIVYPFVNKTSGIGTITLLDGTIIYINSEVYEGYECANDEELAIIKNKTFGDGWEERKNTYSLKKHTVNHKNVN